MFASDQKMPSGAPAELQDAAAILFEMKPTETELVGAARAIVRDEVALAVLGPAHPADGQCGLARAEAEAIRAIAQALGSASGAPPTTP